MNRNSVARQTPSVTPLDPAHPRRVPNVVPAYAVPVEARQESPLQTRNGAFALDAMLMAMMAIAAAGLVTTLQPMVFLVLCLLLLPLAPFAVVLFACLWAQMRFDCGAFVSC